MNDRPRGFPATRSSIIDRIKDWDDQTAWRYLDTTYRPLIYGFAINRGLTELEAEDATQETLLTIAKGIKESKYVRARGSFKNWLFTAARWKINDQFRKRQRQLPIDHRPEDDDRETATVDRYPDPAGSSQQAIWDQEWERNLLDVAHQKVKQQVSGQQYQIFDLYVIKNWPVAKVMKTLNVSGNQVYLAKNRLGPLLEKEVTALKEELE